MGLQITKAEISPVTEAISPTLRATLWIRNVQNNPVDIIAGTGQFYIFDQRGKPLFVSPIHYATRGRTQMGVGSEVTIQPLIKLNITDLNKIEEIRNGEKLRYLIELELSGMEKGTPTVVHGSYDHTIPKSSWVEEILQGVGYGKIEYLFLRLNELKSHEKIVAEIAYLKDAIRSYNDGDYDASMTSARHAVISLESRDKELKLQEIGQLNYKRALSLCSDCFSLAVHPVEQIKTKTPILRRDAEFALLTTLALLRYVGNLIEGKNV